MRREISLFLALSLASSACASRPESKRGMAVNTLEKDRKSDVSWGVAWPHEMNRIDQSLKDLELDWFYSALNKEYLNHPGFVPISRCGLVSELVGLDPNYDGYLMTFNEPNNKEPNGCPLSVDEAVASYKNLRKAYPKAKMVVGNTSIWETNKWLEEFTVKVGLDQPYAYGIHAYVEGWADSKYIKNQLELFLKNTPQARIWITEAGVCSGNLNELNDLVGVFKSYPQIERVAFYTDLQPENVPWGICEGRINLLDKNKNLTEIGKKIASLSK